MLCDRTIDSTAVLNTTVVVNVQKQSVSYTICKVICELLFGIFRELLHDHISGMREYPRGGFTSLLKIVKDVYSQRGQPVQLAYNCTALANQHSVPVLQYAKACDSLLEQGITEIPTRCVSSYLFIISFHTILQYRIRYLFHKGIDGNNQYRLRKVLEDEHCSKTQFEVTIENVIRGKVFIGQPPDSF